MKIVFAIFFVCVISSCQKFDGKTESEYAYKFHIDKEGENAKIGDQVFFSEKVFLNGEEIFSTEKFGQKKIILPVQEILTRPIPPNYEVLFKMSIGDSVTVTHELANLKSLPEGYTTDDVLKYVIKLDDITPKEKLQPLKKKGKTTANYPFEIFHQSGNVLAQPGDRVRFREYRYINDSLVFTTLNKPSQAFLPARDQVPNPPPGNYEALLMTGAGDSIHMSQLLVDVPDLPVSLSKNDTINYRIKILEVFTPGEYLIYKKEIAAKIESKKEAVKARKEEVVKSTQDFINKYKKGELDDDLEYTHSGLKYLVHKKGEGKLPNITEDVSVQFAGFLMDGTLFDTSFETGEPLIFPLGMKKVIKGWDEGISKLAIGSSATFYVPSKLAYGYFGKPPKIPTQADLVFYVEVVDVE